MGACLELLSGVGKKIIVADGPAWDATADSQSIIEQHPLKQICDQFGVTIADVHSDGTRKVKTRSFELEVSEMAFEYDFILSLPVLKSHGMGLTGAIKNQLGLLSGPDRMRSHKERDMHQVVAEVHGVFKPQLTIVDAVETLITANEVRHGGQHRKLGYMLAGTDPVSLDVAGLELLKEVEPKLEGKHFEDILHLKHAVSLGIGAAQYEIIEL